VEIENNIFHTLSASLLHFLDQVNQPDEHTLPIKTTRPTYYQVSILQKTELNKITQKKNTTKLSMHGKNNVNDQKNIRIVIKENTPIQGKDAGAWMCRKIHS